MRMGGDEFIVYSIGMVDYKVCQNRLGQLVERMHSIKFGETDGQYVTVSIGAVINDGTYPTYESLYQVADGLLYTTKERGKDGFTVNSKSY
jgi:diguanylate cyclase (GGDEF)-like protein